MMKGLGNNIRTTDPRSITDSRHQQLNNDNQELGTTTRKRERDTQEAAYADETREQKVVHYNQQGERIVKTKTKT